MKCHNCPVGELAPGTKTVMLERGPTVLVVRHVPGDICDSCGAALYSADTTDRLHALLAEAATMHAEVVVRDFALVENHAHAAR